MGIFQGKIGEMIIEEQSNQCSNNLFRFAKGVFWHVKMSSSYGTHGTREKREQKIPSIS